MAVVNDDPFNAQAETEGWTACRCTHVVECAGMTVGVVTPEPAEVGEVSGKNLPGAVFRVDGAAPCKQSASKHLKYQEYFPKGKRGL